MIIGRIYKISNTKTPDIYVGSTIQELKNRFKTHKSNAKLGNSEKLYEHMREYGTENFTIELLEDSDVPDKSELGLKELEYYKKLNPSLNMIAPKISGKPQYGRIYKVININIEPQFYIGSTTQSLTKRLGQHKSDAKKDGKTKFYQYMKEQDPENFSISLVEDDILLENLTAREDFWIKELKPTLNSNLFLMRTEQERDKAKYEKNREAIKDRVNKRRIEKREEIKVKKREYYLKNKEKILEKQREPESRKKANESRKKANKVKKLKLKESTSSSD